MLARADLELWIRQSDQFAHYAAAIAAGTPGDNYPKPPDSIRQFAREIDALLRDITVCDPAISSGAFPVGMMTEIVRARMALTPYFNDVAERTAYHFKRHVIQSSIHGVDIDASAVEIAKLRLWLSLVVDEDDVQQIKPLPNLDYKIVVGNSLLGFPFKSQRVPIWMSCHSLVLEVCAKHHHLCHFDSHRQLACPVAPWEQLKIGGGTQPTLTPHGWLVLYHGVCEAMNDPASGCKLSYSAGLLVLDEKHPMADSCIDVARLDLPEHLPIDAKPLHGHSLPATESSMP